MEDNILSKEILEARQELLKKYFGDNNVPESIIIFNIVENEKEDINIL